MDSQTDKTAVGDCTESPAKVLKVTVLKIKTKSTNSFILLHNNNYTKNPVQLLNELLAGLGKVAIYEFPVDTIGLFHCRVSFDEMVVECQGDSKKKAKLTAAKAMLCKLIGYNEAKDLFTNDNLIEYSPAPSSTQVSAKETTNFVGALQVFCQAKKLPLPLYEQQVEAGNPPNIVFLTSCTLGGKVVQGSGESKKASKQDAAEEMWKVLMNPVLTQQMAPTDENVEKTNNLEQVSEQVTPTAENVEKSNAMEQVSEQVTPTAENVEKSNAMEQVSEQVTPTAENVEKSSILEQE